MQRARWGRLVATLVLLAVSGVGAAQDAAAPDAKPQPTFKAEELEQLAAPIALYPDPLLAQVLMASTYPLEVVEAARWRAANPDLTGDALSEELKKRDWDASVKSLVEFADVLKMMDEQIEWTQKLGDAFLAQQADLMSAVQRLRAKAQKEGTLKSTKEQKVTTQSVAEAAAAETAADPTETQNAPAATAATAEPPPATVIKIEPTDPQVVYVPTYNPSFVYGAWPYPAYPPYAYYPPGYTAGAAFFSFTASVAITSALWGDCHWGHNSVSVNVNNYDNFNRATSVDRSNAGNRVNTGAGAGAANRQWQHDASHRKGVQYGDAATQQRFAENRSQSAVQSREAFRGRADQGRQELASGAGTRDFSGNRTASGTQRSAGDARAPSNLDGSNRASGQSGSRPQTRDSARSAGSDFGSSTRGAEAYRGMNNANRTRMESNRGYSSRSAGGMSRGGGGFSGGARGGRR